MAHALAAWHGLDWLLAQGWGCALYR